jgi:hypothetical protein
MDCLESTGRKKHDTKETAREINELSVAAGAKLHNLSHSRLTHCAGHGGVMGVRVEETHGQF